MVWVRVDEAQGDDEGSPGYFLDTQTPPKHSGRLRLRLTALHQPGEEASPLPPAQSFMLIRPIRTPGMERLEKILVT